ncbi:MAG TPA: hypothetical protein P5218_08405, partial [Planctomycetota bacterium]|nr:hypothetical protein [Planctomycetota bacterium]
MVRTSLSASARRCGILAALLVGVVLGGAFAQDKELAPERIQKLIEASIHGSPVVRPQAAERLIGAADQVRGAVMERLLQAAAVPDQEGWFPLGPDFLRAAAELAPADGSPDGPRAKLWKAIGESSFPWRAPVV